MKETWDENNSDNQSAIIGYSQIRQHEDNERFIALLNIIAGSRGIL